MSVFRNYSILLALLICFSSQRMVGQTTNNAIPVCFLQNNEKVFVQLDRHILISGEELNYNCFVVNASTHKPGTLSRIVYFELSDAANRPVFAWRSNYDGHCVSGSVNMPDTLLTGTYTLKAYTNWMRNFSPAFFYSTSLFIGRISDDEVSTYNVPAFGEPSLSVFPEGGRLYYDHKSSVGVRVAPSRKCKIEFLNAAKEVVNEGYTNDEGRAVLSFTPQLGQTYEARVSDLDGKKITSQPLIAESAGYALAVEYKETEMGIHISTCQAPSINSGLLRLLVRSRGRLLAAKNVTFTNGVDVQTLKLDSLPSGILDIELIDNASAVIAQRLAAVMPKKVEPQLTVSNVVSQNNQPIDVSIQNSEKVGAQNAEAAVVVSLKEPVKAVNSTITNYLLFASELANASLNTDSFSIKQADLLLQTSAFTDYLWNKSRFDTIRSCAYVTEHKGYVLEGRVVLRGTGAPVVRGMVILSVPDSIPMIKTCATDAQGRFFFRLNNYFDNRQITLQLHDPKAELNVDWIVDDKGTEQKPVQLTPQLVDNKTKLFLATCRDLQVVRAIYKADLVALPKANVVDMTMVNNFSIKPTSVLVPADYSELKDFNEIASNIMPTVSFKKTNKGYELRVIDLKNNSSYGVNAGLILNGSPFYDLAYLATLGSADIRHVDVFNTQVFIGDFTMYGLISVYTTDKKMPKSYLENKNICFISNKVASSVPEELYRTNSLADTKLPDFKRSLCVKSKPLIGSNLATLRVNPSIYKGVYDLSVQGLTQDGETFEKHTIIDIK